MSRSKKILVVASPGLRAGLLEQLALYPEFELAESGTLEDCARLVEDTTPDLMLLDAECGVELAAIARSFGFAGPILLLGGAAGEATERIAKPFRFADLLARIRENLRPRADEQSDLVAVGAYRFRPGSNNLVHAQGKSLRLTEKETAILSRLARARGDTVSRDVLLRDVWGYNPAVTTRTLETHIYRLRRKIEPDPSNARLLVTENKGYRLISRVEA